MEKQYANYFSSSLIKRQGAGLGSLRVFDWRDVDPAAPCLTLFIEIETSDKENEKIITTLAEVLSDQFFNAPTETVEFAFESALAKANISIKDTLLIKPKNWLNKIHILVVAGRDQELHLSSVGRAHAFLVHRDQIVDVVGQNENSRPGALGMARTPNPVKLFSNIVSGRLLGQDALVISNESVLDYLSPERIRKTAQDFEPNIATAKFEELLAAAPANKQFALAIIKRLPLPAKLAPETPLKSKEPVIIAEEETIVEKYLKPESPRSLNRREAVVFDKILATTGRAGKSALKVTARYSQIGLTATLSGLSKSLEIIQSKLSTAVPRIGRAPKFVVTLWKDDTARNYHLSRFKNNWRARLAKIQNSFSALPGQQKRVLLATLALVFIFLTSIIWRAYGNSTAADKAVYQTNLSAVGQKIDQAEASLIYRDEARSRELLGEINSLLGATKPATNEDTARFNEFKTKADNIQNTLDKKQVLGQLSAWLNLPIGADDKSGLISLGGSYYAFSPAAKKIFKIDMADASASEVAVKGEIRPFKTAIAYDNSNLALIGDVTLDLLNIKNGEIAAKNLATGPAEIRAWASYARNLYALAPGASSIIRYKENELANPQPWLKEPADLTTGADIAVDGQVYVLTDSALNIFASGRPDSAISLPLSDKLGPKSRLAMDANLNSLFILDSDHERLLHLSKKGDLYNQYLSPDLKNATNLVAAGDEKYVYAISGDKIFRLEILPPA